MKYKLDIFFLIRFSGHEVILLPQARVHISYLLSESPRHPPALIQDNIWDIGALDKCLLNECMSEFARLSSVVRLFVSQ